MSLQHTPVNRRQLLKGAAALGALGSLWLVTGCESAVGQTENTTGASGGAPQKGGTITAGISVDLIPGNLFTNSTVGITTVVGLVYDSLIRYPNDAVTPTPRLATTWQLSADGLSLALDLRDDVKFHSGRPFTSADVAFSIKTYADPKWNGQLKSTAAAITAIDTSDPHRAVLTFAHPLGNIFDLLDTIPIVDSESIDKLGTGEAFVGTGPFVFESWQPNSKLTFSANPNYWQPDRPYVDAVDVSVISDPKSLLAAVKSGQVDFANGLSYRDIETLVGDGSYNSVVLEGAEQQIYVGATVTAAPLDDVRVRHAIAYALDRNRIVSEVFRSVGYPINLPWPKYSPAFQDSANATYPTDPEKARALVAQIGQIPTIPLTYGAPAPLVEATAAIVQANLAEVGIPVELDPIDSAQFVKQLIGAQFKGLWVTFHSWAQYTPSTLTVSAYPFNARKNSSQYASDQYVADADAAWIQPDGTSQAAVDAYRTVSQDLLDALFLIEIAIVQPQWVTAPRLTGVSYTKRAEVQFTDASLG